jgi:tetratricopeptide (TPR) repeat protein
VRGGEETLRRSIAVTADARARARLRVELAALVRARDPAAARDELTSAAREAGTTPALALAATSVARQLTPVERLSWLTSFGAPSPTLVVLLAEAQRDVGRIREAAATLLALAKDDGAAMHHRRLGARKAVSLLDGAAGKAIEPSLACVILQTAAGLASGRARRELLRRALTITAEHAISPEAMVSLGLDWLRAGGEERVGREVVARVRAHGHSSPEFDRLIQAVEPPARPARAVPPPRPSQRRTQAPAPPDPKALFETAIAEARAGRGLRARRLGEQALRLAPPGEVRAAHCSTLVGALHEAKLVRDALRLRRTLLEDLADPAPRRTALLALASEAEASGLPGLARDWRVDAGMPAGAAVPAPAERPPTSPAEHYIAAQRMLARGEGEAAPAQVLVMLEKALAGHRGADAALALAEKLATRAAVITGSDPSKRRLDLLRAAHAAESEPARRARLGWRLAAQLEAVGDAIGAVAVLERALAESAPGDGARVRGERARLLRSLGRKRELEAALEKDVGALSGDARLPALAEQAELLDAAGEPDRALDVRLLALAEFPGAPALLDDARRRLEATDRAGESLALAIAALDHTTDRERRLQLLRDVAALSEQAGADASATDAANAWLAVLELEPADAMAAAAAERLLVATGDWERCADLLAWQIARASAMPPLDDESDPTAALMWRLAELRRARLGQEDEALRLYAQLAERGPPLGPLADPADLVRYIRRDPVLATATARALVAPTAAERARALVDRATLFAERARAADAESDALAALDLDPGSAAVLAVLERLYEGEAGSRALGDELARRAANLPPLEAAPLHYGRGRAAERYGNRAVAREAYRKALTLDPNLAEPLAALSALAAREGDWNEVATLLEGELGRATSAKRKGPLLLELAIVYGDRLKAPSRALALLETAASLLPDEPRRFDLSARFHLAAGNWQAAAEALDRLAARGAPIADAAERYYAVGAAAEEAGQIDRALTLYSRAYGRDNGHRPTLERLVALCFARGQWDNTWKATEALLERHGPSLEPAMRATLIARSMIADLHIGMRASAIAKLRAIVTRGPSYSPEAGIRDVAESWAGMHLEPRLLVDVDARRRERVLARASEVLALTEGGKHPARREALEMLGALAVAEGRWHDALGALEVLSADEDFSTQRRSEFLVTAAELVGRNYRDADAAQQLYDRARALWPHNPGLPQAR